MAATIDSDHDLQPGIVQRAHLRNLRALKRGILYTVGVVLTAVIGWWVNDYFNRADISVYLTSASIDSPTERAQAYEASLREQQGLYAYGSDYPREAKLESLAEQSLWLGGVRTETFDDYLGKVYTVRQDAGIAREYISGLHRALARWPERLSELNLDSVYNILRDHSEAVTGALFGEVRRGGTVFAGTAPALGGRKQFYDIAEDSDGDFYVDSGKHRLPIVWTEQCGSGQEKLKQECKQTAERLAKAIAFLVIEDLTTLKSFLDKVVAEEPTLLEAFQQAQDEIERYSYWRITVTLANDGREPIAVSPWGYMIVRPPAEDKKSVNPLEPANMEAPATKISIPVQVVEKRVAHLTQRQSSVEVDYEQPSDAPTVIEAGKAISVTMRSTERISSTEDGKKALLAFRKNHASVALSVLPLTSRRLNGKPRQSIHTQAIEFGELDTVGR